MRFFAFTILIVLLHLPVAARVNYVKYVQFSAEDSASVEKKSQLYADEQISQKCLLVQSNVYNDIQPVRYFEWQTLDFYFIVLLCLFLGVIRAIDHKYFNSLWLALANRSLSSGKIQDQLENAGLPDLLMNCFFTIVFGLYVYFILRYFVPNHQFRLPHVFLIGILVVGTGLIYIMKYLSIRISGWAFRVESITEQYLFNVFLLNKIIAVVLMPFVIFIAFGADKWRFEMIVVSFVAVGLLLLMRYVRSWQVFEAFLQYSKFHFFLYLCASELLPLAVLIKLLAQGLISF